MFSKTTTPSATRRHLAETHARMMFAYYYLRALLETTGAVAAREQEATRYLAIESRRFGFRLEAQAEQKPLGLMLGTYDEEGLRREAYRAAQLSASDPTQALAIERRVVEQVATAALTAEEEVGEAALAA
jgi:hypothetical protein